MISNLEALSYNGQPATSLDCWLARRGFLVNPFERWNAEHDRDMPNYFVDIGGFDELLRFAEPCVVFAKRGCGKTAQRQMLATHYRPTKRDSQQLALTYTYDGFERVLSDTVYDVNQVRSWHHVSIILHLGLTALSREAERDSKVQNALASPDVVSRWKAYVAHFAPHLVDSPTVETPKSLKGLGSLELLKGFAGLIQNVGLGSCVVLLDGLDEFPLTANDPAKAVAFLAPLLGALTLIECQGMAFKFFLPQELEQALRTWRWFRVDRLHVFRIVWSKRDLSTLLQQRLSHFSHRQPPYEDLAQLCEDELAPTITDELTTLAAESPRTALILANKLLQSHCQQSNPPDLIALQTWKQVKEAWQHQRADFVMEEIGRDMQPDVTEFVLPPSLAVPGHPVMRIDEEKGLVWLGEREIRSEIKPKDYCVLLSLYRHKKAVCDKDLLAQEAWPEEDSKGVSEQAIAASIARLRKAIRQSARPDIGYIETVRGKRREQGGYRLHPEGFLAS